MAMEAERLARGSPHPVIAAGSTGTVPATARLLEVIASLPNGAVVLPGLDKSLDEESWATLSEHPEHAQAGMAELLRRLGMRRDEVTNVPGSEPDPASRAQLYLASEALRPAESTEHWQEFLAAEDLSPEGRASVANALAGMRLVVAPNAHEEAEAIALILRDPASKRRARPRRSSRPTACSRGAWRRGSSVTIWREFDESRHGIPVARTVPGAFLGQAPKKREKKERDEKKREKREREREREREKREREKEREKREERDISDVLCRTRPCPRASALEEAQDIGKRSRLGPTERQTAATVSGRSRAALAD